MINKTAPKLKPAIARLNATFDSLGSAIIGREDVLRQLKFALITKNHLLLEGPPGVAKSFMANLAFSGVTGSSLFKVQCTRKMSEDYIVGPLDMRKFRNEGTYEHRVEGSMVTSDFAFVDEFLDLAPNTLRALLEILNERTFTRGTQRVDCRLWTAVAATNFSGDNDDALEAVMDRFLFKATVQPLNNREQRKLMLLSKDPTISTVRFSDIKMINRAIHKVRIPDNVLDAYLSVCDQLSLTDRYVKQALDVVKAAAVLEGRGTARIRDISALDTAFCKVGDDQSSMAWSKAFSSQYKTALAEEERIIDMNILGVRVNELLTLANLAELYGDIHPVAVEAREAQMALSSLSGIKAVHATAGRARKKLDSILNKADTLYQTSISNTIRN